MGLRDDFLLASRDEIEKNAHYFAIYERYLAHLVNRACVLFVIIDGAHALAQARMWARFLGPASRIVGLTDWEGDDHQVSFRKGELRDGHFRRRLLAEFGSPDVVIDDGSHLPAATIGAFECLGPHLATAGLYVIEDVYTAYWENYEGGLGRNETVVSYVKAMVDELHASFTGGAIPPNAFDSRICGIHVFEGLVIFEYGRFPDRRSITNRTG